MTLYDAQKKVRERNYYGPMMVVAGDADAVISGQTRKYPDVVKAFLNTIGPSPNPKQVTGMYIMLSKRGPLFFADTTIVENPTAEEIVQITLNVADAVQRINVKPRIALLSFSNFGSHSGEVPRKMQKAVSILRSQHPHLVVDGEMQANFALNHELLKETFPFSDLVKSKPNVFIFPDLASANIAYKMIQSFGSAEALGPILLGMNQSAHVIQMSSSVREIVNMATLAVVDAQTRQAAKVEAKGRRKGG